MSNDLPPLKYLGTQSRETVNMDIALAEKSAAEASGHGARSLAEHLHDGAEAGAAMCTRSDPLRATLIAAGAGALLMVLATRVARSGARAVRRRVHR